MFGHDDAGNVDSIVDSVYGLHQTFDQDVLHRLDYDAGSYGAKTLLYDENSNRETQTGGTAKSLSYHLGTNRLATHDPCATPFAARH